MQHVRSTVYYSRGFCDCSFFKPTRKRSSFCGRCGTYRRRWGKLIAAFQIPAELELTPGSLRAGGAVHSYHTNMPIGDIMWKMRLKQQSTLESYLQETAALSTVHKVEKSALSKIKSCAVMLPHVMRPFTS